MSIGVVSSRKLKYFFKKLNNKNDDNNFDNLFLIDLNL